MTPTTTTTYTTNTGIVDAKDFASFLGCDQATIYKRVHAGTIPSGSHDGRKMVWNLASIDIEACKKAVSMPVVRMPRVPRVPDAPKPVITSPKETRAPKPSNDPKHAKYPTLIYYLSRRRHVYAWGPMGSGKSHGAQQAADELGLQYAYVSLNPQSPASLLSGFIDAQGRYVRTKFRDCYEFGGVFCIDELDNSSSSLLTTLNSALANGHCAFPDGMIQRHGDFVLVATGNTTGRGGDWQYPERRKVDEATLDRLAFIHWGYDESLENGIVARLNPDARVTAPWVMFIRRVREYVQRRENGIKGGVYATPRAMFAGVDDITHAPASIDIAAIADSTVFKGLDVDTRARVLNAVPLPVINRVAKVEVI